MTESHDGAPISLQELTDLLRIAAEQATFDISGRGTCTASQLRSIYRDRTLFGDNLLAYTKPQLDENLLAELTSLLRSLLGKYILNDCIGNGFADFLGGPTELELSLLTTDAIKATAVLGSERAAQLLCKWESGEAIPYRRCAVLSGVSIEYPLEIEEGIRFESLPKSSGELSAHLPFSSTLHFGDLSLLGAVKVTIDCQAKPAFYKPGGHDTIHERISAYGPIWSDSLDALYEALSLACNHYVSCRIEWSECDEADAFSIGVFSGGMFREQDLFRFGSTQLAQEHLEEARVLFVKRLTGRNASRSLDLAISRWMRSKQHTSYADQFIELRIALEALYLKRGGGELGFRVANYGAWHLGADFDKRCQYQKILHQAYSQASTAIHAGEVKNTPKNRDLLTAAQDLCREGILKRLNESEEPNWTEMILGKGSRAPISGGSA